MMNTSGLKHDRFQKEGLFHDGVLLTGPELFDPELRRNHLFNLLVWSKVDEIHVL